MNRQASKYTRRLTPAIPQSPDKLRCRHSVRSALGDTLEVIERRHILSWRMHVNICGHDFMRMASISFVTQLPQHFDLAVEAPTDLPKQRWREEAFNFARADG